MNASKPTQRPERPWRVERHGIEPIPDAERYGKPQDLFWIWFAANVGILAVTYGGFLVVFYRLNLWQTAAATIVGVVVSFLLVGVISLAGARGGAPTLVLSRAPFGLHGNALPTLVSYVTLVGFEIVLSSLATLAAQTVLGRLGAPAGQATLAVAFATTAALAVSISLLGHATIQRVQTWFAVAFAILTVALIALESRQVHWHKVATLPSGRLVGGLLGGLSIVMAGTGITWTSAAADYSRYLPGRSRARALVGWTTLGASLPLVVLILFGALLAASDPSVATSSNPIGLLAAQLPSWFLVPYLLVAVGGLVAEVLLASYSGGLNLLTLGIRIARYKSVLIDSLLLIGGSVYMLFYARSFFAPFEGFLFTVGVPLAAWAAIFLIDFWLLRGEGYSEHDLYDACGRYGKVNGAGLAALLLATALGWGLVTSTSPAFDWVGYLLRYVGGRKGAVGASSIGLLVGFLAAAGLYLALARLRLRPRIQLGESADAAQPS